MKRVFLIVLDSCGVGYEPDAADFGDVGANTLHTCSRSPKFAMPNLISMGLGNLDGVDYLPKTDQPQAALARLQELSRGKDTTIGHWEIAGLVSPQPLPTFPHGFPAEILKPLSEQTGRGVLCNLPDSGTEVIKDYGAERGKEFSGVEKTGLQTLDGVQALCYGRIRKGDTGDDWARVERQSVVLNAIFTKLQSASATELIGSMRKLVPYVTTSLSPTDMASLIVGAVKNGIPTLEHTRIPVDGEWSYSGNSGEYITYDLDVAADHIHAYIYDDADISSGTTDDDTGTDSKSDTDTTDSSKSTDTKSNTTAVDPESLVEEGGWYDSDTGDYYDCDGDRYSLDENGNKVYY